MLVFVVVFMVGLLLVLGVFTIRRQIVTLKRLRADADIPSDEREYLRSQARRRMLMSVLILGLAGMLSGAFVSQLEFRAEQLGQKKPAAELDANGPIIKEQDVEFLRFYIIYWSSTLLLIFVLVSMAIVDIVATRRYAWQQLRRIQSENRSILERDLAMYRQQKANDRMRGAK